MNKYYIVDENNHFWCEHNIGYWSEFEESLKYRFEGIFIWVFPLYLMMRCYRVKCQMKTIIKSED